MELRRRYNNLPSETDWATPLDIILPATVFLILFSFLSTKYVEGFYVIAVPFGVLILTHSIVCRTVPLYKLQEFAGVFGVLMVMSPLFELQVTPQLMLDVLAITLAVSYVYDDGYLYELVITLLQPNSGVRFLTYTNTVSTNFAPVYKSLFLQYLPTQIQSWLYNSGITVVVIPSKLEKPTFAFETDSKQEYLDTYINPNPFGEMECTLCNETGVHTGPYTATTNLKERTVRDVFMCDSCREEMVEETVDSGIVEREDVLVTSI